MSSYRGKNGTTYTFSVTGKVTEGFGVEKIESIPTIRI